MGKSKILSMISILAMIVISFSFMACGSGNKAQSLAIRYDDESFYLGDKKNEIDKILGSPISNVSYEDVIRYCYIEEYSGGVYIEYDQDGKSKKIEIFSDKISVNGIKIGDTCDKVVAMFPKYEYKYKESYNAEAKLKVTSVDNSQGYNIYMKNNQNIDKDTYDKYKEYNKDLYYWIKIPYTPENNMQDLYRNVSRIIIGK